MKLHFLAPASFVLLLVLGACNNATPSGNLDAANGSSVSSQAAVPSKPLFQFIPYTDASEVPGSDIRVINVEANNFTFVPGVIVLKKGEKVALKVTATQGNHSIMITDLGVNVKVAEGETVYVNIPTEKAGSFLFRCAVPCGPGHLDMIGRIEIQ